VRGTMHFAMPRIMEAPDAQRQSTSLRAPSGRIPDESTSHRATAPGVMHG